MQFCLTTATKARAADVLVKADGFGWVGHPLSLLLNQLIFIRQSIQHPSPYSVLHVLQGLKDVGRRGFGNVEYYVANVVVGF